MIRPLAIAAALALAGCAAESEPPPSVAAPPTAPAPLAPATVPPAAVDASVRDAQSHLRRLGYYRGPVDGIWGPETEEALQRFQRDRGLPADGTLGDQTLSALRNAPTPASGASSSSAAPRSRPVAINDPTTVRTVQNRLKQLGFYDGAADGVWGAETQQGLERFQRSKGMRPGELTTASISAMGLDPADFPSGTGAAATLDPRVVRAVQTRLRQDGFYRGGIDGTWGPGTEGALQRFQRERGFEATGQLTPPTIAALGLDPNNLVASAEAALGGAGSSRR